MESPQSTLIVRLRHSQRFSCFRPMSFARLQNSYPAKPIEYHFAKRNQQGA